MDFGFYGTYEDFSSSVWDDYENVFSRMTLLEFCVFDVFLIKSLNLNVSTKRWTDIQALL